MTLGRLRARSQVSILKSLLALANHFKKFSKGGATMPLGQLNAAGSGEFRKPKIGPWEGVEGD